MNQMNGIGSSQQFPIAQDTAGTSRAGRTGRTTGIPAGAGAIGADQTNLSGTVNVVALALSGSDVRMDRVSTLQSAIAAGMYNVAASNVASKLLNSLMT
ncbi:MAG TPA: flagellar biosynthesis anti-sigma factor FlgM [Acidobacteriaceae bacterium]|nr:flagellar biosynthesis anti-sigma factor FlgM [Acidobacteriaceae bacterium]